jgi:hypothetical protein
MSAGQQWFLASPVPVVHNVYRQEDPATIVDTAAAPAIPLPTVTTSIMGVSTAAGAPFIATSTSAHTSGATAAAIISSSNHSSTGEGGLSQQGASQHHVYPQHNNIPFLSVVLSRLTTVLPEFCFILAEGPSLSSASR